MTRALSLTALSVALLLGCGGGLGARARQPKDEATRLQEKLSFVQAVACLSPAEEEACDPGLAATFAAPGGPNHGSVSLESSPSTPAAERKTGTLWCEGGRPHVRVTTPSGDVEGEFGQVVWEAIWRVLKATDSCASANGAAVVVSRNGQSHACKDPRFDMGSLLGMATFLAKNGPPRKRPPARRRQEDLCALDPSSCIDTRTMCPLFLGDVWSGVTSAPPAEEAADTDTPPDDTPSPDDAAGGAEKPPSKGSAADSGKLPQRPPRGEMTRAIGAVLGEARRCLKAGGDPARVAVVFQPSGAVQRVDVTSAGSAAPACLQRSLGKAHVGRFSGPTFEIGLTIRSHD